MTLAEAAQVFRKMNERAVMMQKRFEPDVLEAAMESVVRQAPELVAKLPGALGADGGSSAEALKAMMGTLVGQVPSGQPTEAERRRFAAAIRETDRQLGRDDELLAPMEWQQGRGPVIADLDLSVGEMLEKLASALDDPAAEFATDHVMLRARLPSVDDPACNQALAYVHGWLSRTLDASDDDELDGEPRDLACDYAREHLDEFCWSVTDEYSPFGNDAGADMFSFAASDRLSPSDIWEEVSSYMAEEWDFDGTLPHSGAPSRIEVDIAQHLVGAAFASIVLWGEVAPKLADVGVVAAKLLGRTVVDPGDRNGFAGQCERMAQSIAAAPVAGAR